MAFSDFVEQSLIAQPQWLAGEESLDVQLFHEADIPWEQIAFRSVAQTLKRYFADQRAGRFQIHTFDIT